MYEKVIGEIMNKYFFNSLDSIYESQNGFKDQGDFYTVEFNLLGHTEKDVKVKLNASSLSIMYTKGEIYKELPDGVYLSKADIKKSYFKMEGGVLKLFIYKPEDNQFVEIGAK